MRRRALAGRRSAAATSPVRAVVLCAVIHIGGRDSGSAMTPEEMVSRVLYRDGLMLVIDKPAGYRGAQRAEGRRKPGGPFDALRFGLPRAPALAHRLDRDTSGCLVLGRHRKALATLGKLFKDGRVGKTYWAGVEGGQAEDEGRIDLALGRTVTTSAAGG